MRRIQVCDFIRGPARENNSKQWTGKGSYFYMMTEVEKRFETFFL
jgi:hypothetical protein